MPHMYHPDLPTGPDYNPVEIPDDDGLVAVMVKAGWGVVEPPEQTDPSKAAVQPGATYVVKNPEPAPSRPAVSAVRDDWADYVAHLGGDPEGLTKAELQAKADELEGTDSD